MRRAWGATSTVGPCLWLIILCVVLDRVAGLSGARIVGIAALVLFLAATWPSSPPVGRIFIAASVAAAALLLRFDPAPLATLERALLQACYFAALFTALALIREPARSSRLVVDAGAMLIRQPPGRRYLMLTVGSHLFGVILNFGVVGMLGVMVARSNRPGAAESDAEEPRIRERRAMLAIMRGYAAVMAWSPLTVGIAVVLSALPALSYEDLAPVGVTVAAATIALGWLVDRIEYRPGAGHGSRTPATRFDAPLLGRMLGLIGAIVGCILSVAALLGLQVIEAVMLAVPPAASIWLIFQYRRRGASLACRYAFLRLLRWSRDALPQQSYDTAILCCAGFLGVAIAALLSLIDAQALVVKIPAPAVLIPIAAFWSIIAFGQVGVTPIVAVTMLGAMLRESEAIGVPTHLLLTAYLGGWVMTSQLSPFTANTLTIAHLCDTDSTTVTRRWNGAFAVVALTLGTLLLLVGGLWPPR